MQAARLRPGVIRVEVPEVIQREDHTCGAAAMLAIARLHGVAPRDERAVVRDMRFGLAGSDPVDLRRAAARYGLAVSEVRGMSHAELRGWLDQRCAVILMLQAWGDAPRGDHRHAWDAGHWVVAIGHDRRGVYFMDPSLPGARGVLSDRALAARWHDVEGRARRHVERYGLVIHGGRTRRAARPTHARPIG